MKTPAVIPLDSRVDLLALNTAFPDRYPYLLDSVSRHPRHGRYDILFVALPEQLQLSRHGIVSGNAMKDGDNDFLLSLDRWWQRERADSTPDSILPFTGGWFLYLGYELAAQIEPTLALPAQTDSLLPVAMAVRCPAAVINDHQQGTSCLVCEAGHETLLQRLLTDLTMANAATSSAEGSISVLQEDHPSAYLHGVERIKRYIRDGDIFQVNLSRAWHGNLEASVGYDHVYRQLRTHNPAPFAGICRFPRAAILSSSPERLVRVDRRRRIETRPIAGTHPRGKSASLDRRLSQRLLAHPKEKAEHIMLIDLERNDLGRICRPGTIHVDELLGLETYAHVHHIVSNISGELSPATTPGQVIRSVFPGGTITGCPKVRCMEIISELEQCPRGAYTGSMGFLNLDGSLDLNILIRTITVEGRRLSFRAGAGIVADSSAQRELEETRSKALGMEQAIRSFQVLQPC